MAKIDEAVKILRAEENKGKSRKEFIFLLMTNLKMTDAGASTYYYNATKRIATEDAIVGLEVKEAPIDTKIEDTTVAPVAAEQVVEIAVPEKAMAEASQRTPRFSLDTGSVEIDEFVAQIDINSIPKFLRKK